MAIVVPNTRQLLATYYGTIGAHVGCATGNPGTTATPASEATGGGYVRKPTTWTPGTTGSNQGSAVALDVAPATYSWMLMATAASGANMFDAYDITDVVMSVAGQIVITPQYNQT